MDTYSAKQFSTNHLQNAKSVEADTEKLASEADKIDDLIIDLCNELDEAKETITQLEARIEILENK